jgi:hypothetical protein
VFVCVSFVVSLFLVFCLWVIAYDAVRRPSPPFQALTPPPPLLDLQSGGLCVSVSVSVSMSVFMSMSMSLFRDHKLIVDCSGYRYPLGVLRLS